MCDYINCYASSEAYAAIIAAVIGLIGGLLAVAAAVVVGLRQSEILTRQTDVANRMAEVEELRLKSELYDRRIAVYTGVSQMIEFVQGHGRTPRDKTTGRLGLGKNEAEIVNQFYAALSSAHFLFPSATNQELHNIAAMLFALDHHNEAFAKLGEAKPEETESQMSARIEEMNRIKSDRFDLISQFMELSRRLPLMFPELNLSNDGAAYRASAEPAKPNV